MLIASDEAVVVVKQPPLTDISTVIECVPAPKEVVVYVFELLLCSVEVPSLNV